MQLVYKNMFWTGVMVAAGWLAILAGNALYLDSLTSTVCPMNQYEKQLQKAQH